MSRTSFPGERWRDQVRAVVDVLGRQHVGPSVAGCWDALVAEIAAWPGTAVISMEFLGPATPEQIATLLRSLGDSRVEVVMTLRDLGRTVPAMWQEIVQNGAVIGWSDWVASLARDQPTVGGFWRQFSMARITENWMAGVGADRVTLVTVPPAGADPELLWGRFCAAAGSDGSGCADPGPRTPRLMPPPPSSYDTSTWLFRTTDSHGPTITTL